MKNFEQELASWEHIVHSQPISPSLSRFQFSASLDFSHLEPFFNRKQENQPGVE